MELDSNLLKEFAKMTNDSEVKNENKYLRGTILKTSGGKFVQLDGSTTATPISEIVDVQEGDRVLVTIENHKATIVGNFSFPPSARKEQEALNNANAAQGTANQAGETANAAQLKAKEASDKADEAINKSSIASASANEAKDQANNALSKAESAQANVQEAKDLANQASANATEAKNQAAASQASSADAQAEVARLQNEVNEAKSSIDNALADLETQAGEIEGIKEEYALSVELDNAKADLSSQITKKVGELQATVEKDYSTKTENIELEGRLQTQITENAEGFAAQASKIEKLEGDTSEAQKDVEDALAKATAAQSTATEAQTKANEAKTAADQAITDAQSAINKAQIAQNAAEAATTAANAADKAVQQAQGDLDEARQNLATVTSRVDATEAEIAEAQEKVDAAQEAVNEALADAAEARLAADNATEAANKAQQDAETAQGTATAAQQKADNAQTAANNAQAAANKAQEDVAALTKRITTAETNISNNADEIRLNASKTEEIGDTLKNDYYKKTETNALITEQSDRITSTVSRVETVEKGVLDAQSAADAAQEDIDNLEIGGRNLLPDTDFNGESKLRTEPEGGTGEGGFHFIPTLQIESGVEYTLSARIRGTSDIVFYQINEGGNVSQHWIKKEDLSDTEYRKFDITFTVSTDHTFVDVYICTKYGTTIADEWFEIEPCSLKLEKGNKATDWSPAPEDVESDINDAQNTADSANTIANSAQTSVTEAHSLIQQLSDMIANLVTDSNGTSLMTQTSKGWTFNMATIIGNLEAIQKAMENMNTDHSETNNTLTKFEDLLNSVVAKTAYVNIGTDENGYPCIELGKSENTFKVRITNTAIDFLEGSTKIAYANNNTFYAEKMIVKNELQIGIGPGFVWRTRANGNMGLVYISG